MKLRDWMAENGFTDATFAAAVTSRLDQGGTCSAKTVEKWRYATRTPRRKMMSVIAEITGNKVMPNDFADITAKAA